VVNDQNTSKPTTGTFSVTASSAGLVSTFIVVGAADEIAGAGWGCRAAQIAGR
jgi:hypothetical protein